MSSRSTEGDFCGRTIGLDAPNPYSCRDGRTGFRRHRRRGQRGDAGRPGRWGRRPRCPAPARGDLRPPGCHRLRQGQQRRRRTRRRATSGRLGRPGRPVRPTRRVGRRRLRPSGPRSGTRPGRPGHRRHVRHRVPGGPGRRRRLRRPGDDGRRLPGAGGRHPLRRRRPHRRGHGASPSRPWPPSAWRASSQALCSIPVLPWPATWKWRTIGINPNTPPPSLGLTEEADVCAWLPRRPPESHKWSVGAVYVVGGSQGMTGAVMLAARAALRAGAGMVIAGLPGDAAARASGGEVITRPLPATASGALDEDAAKEVLDGLDRFRALVVGPGPRADGVDRGRRAPSRGRGARPARPRRRRPQRPRRRRRPPGRPAGRHDRDAPRRGVRPPGRRTGGGGPGGRRPPPGRTGRARSCSSKAAGRWWPTPPGGPPSTPPAGPGWPPPGPATSSPGIVGALAAMGLPAFRAATAGAWLHGRAARRRRP